MKLLAVALVAGFALGFILERNLVLERLGAAWRSR